MNIQYEKDEEEQQSFLSNYPSIDISLSKESYFQVTPDLNQKQIIHKVQYEDTLQGLSLTYSVSISKIKQRNNIEGDSIYYLKEIIIPNPAANPTKTDRTQQIKIQQFMTYMPREQKSSKVAKYYLSENDWDIQKSVKSFRDDLQWQRKNNMTIKSIPLQQIPNKRYTLKQIEIKKQS